MTDATNRNTKTTNTVTNPQRRKMLQGAACIGAVSFTPAVLGKAATVLSEQTVFSTPALSGELVCSISNPVKTLVLRNRSDRAMVIKQFEQAAMMFDGSIVDCNTACLNKSITIPANQEIRVQFDRRQQTTLTHLDNFNRVQARVERLGNGTRVIPFTAELRGSVAIVA